MNYISLYDKWLSFKDDFKINIKNLFFSFHKTSTDIIPYLSCNEKYFCTSELSTTYRDCNYFNCTYCALNYFFRQLKRNDISLLTNVEDNIKNKEQFYILIINFMNEIDINIYEKQYTNFSALLLLLLKKWDLSHYIYYVINNIKVNFKNNIQDKIYELLNIIDNQKVFIKGFITDENMYLRFKNYIDIEYIDGYGLTMLNHAVIEKDYNFINFLLIEGALKNNHKSKYNNILAISSWKYKKNCDGRLNKIILKYSEYSRLNILYYKIYNLLLDNDIKSIEDILITLKNNEINFMLDTMNNSIIYSIITKQMLNLFMINGLIIIPEINLMLLSLSFTNNKLFTELILYLLELGCVFFNINQNIDIYNNCIKIHSKNLIENIEKNTPMYKDLINIVINYIYE